MALKEFFRPIAEEKYGPLTHCVNPSRGIPKMYSICYRPVMDKSVSAHLQ
jgi:hypothetical protein